VNITVLLVDDVEAIRQSVGSMLLETGRFQVIGEAVDGLEAVQKAEELQPDLILLDIRLPKLDGIAAARQIRKLSPKSKIVFLTGNDDPEMVEEALSTCPPQKIRPLI
jgi:DNA-binding NarL/FixJ family response regulator